MLENIKNIIKLTTDCYLEKHLPKIPEDKKQIAINAYEKDLERLALFVFNSGFLNEDFLINEDFIKELHKNLYPYGYVQKVKDAKGREFISMIPGEYKKIKIISNDRKNVKDLPNWKPNYDLYEIPENINKKIQNILLDFNSKFAESSLFEKKDLIFFLNLDLVFIHPFSDGNGRMISILLDLLLSKIGLKPIGLKLLASKNKIESNKSTFLAYQNRDLKYIYDFIETYKNN